METLSCAEFKNFKDIEEPPALDQDDYQNIIEWVILDGLICT